MVEEKLFIFEHLSNIYVLPVSFDMVDSFQAVSRSYLPSVKLQKHTCYW